MRGGHLARLPHDHSLQRLLYRLLATKEHMQIAPCLEHRLSSIQIVLCPLNPLLGQVIHDAIIVASRGQGNRKGRELAFTETHAMFLFVQQSKT